MFECYIDWLILFTEKAAIAYLAGDPNISLTVLLGSHPHHTPPLVSCDMQRSQFVWLVLILLCFLRPKRILDLRPELILGLTVHLTLALTLDLPHALPLDKPYTVSWYLAFVFVWTRAILCHIYHSHLVKHIQVSW